MTKEEIKAMKEVHYRNIKSMCYNYQDKETCYKFTFIEETIKNLTDVLTSAFNLTKDNRLIAINNLIDNLIKERDRIIEIDKLSVSDD